MSVDQDLAADLIRGQQLMQEAVAVEGAERAAKFTESEALIRPLVIEKPNELEVRKVYAQCLIALERFQDAIDVLMYNIGVYPRDVNIILQIAILYDRMGQEDKALLHYNRAVELDPQMASAHWARGFFLLRRCDRWRHMWKAAIEDYEWCRVASAGAPGLIMPVSRPTRSVHEQWDGSPIPGKILYLTNEQGAGDSLMMARFVRLAKERSQATVVLETSQGLYRLMQTLDGPDILVMQQPYGAFAWAFDEHCPLMSLPHALGLSIEDIEASRVYRFLGDGLERGPDTEKQPLKVGVCWKGNPQHPGDAARSIPYEVFAKAWEGVDGVQLVSLQYGETPFEGDTAPTGDYFDTAKRVMSLDLVITVDSSVAHLAGSLGIPCWMLSNKGGDWRWFESRLDTIWYSTVRVYRQDVQGDWDSLIPSINNDLSMRAYTPTKHVQQLGTYHEPPTTVDWGPLNMIPNRLNTVQINAMIAEVKGEAV